MRVVALLGVALLVGAAAAASGPGVRVTGTPRADVLQGTSARDNLQGRGGNDRLFGYAGRDQLNGGRGDDALIGGDGGDLLIGGSGDDRSDAQDQERSGCALRSRRLASTSPLDYPPCADVLLAGPGNDLILIRDGRFDVIWSCGTGRDAVIADRRDGVAGDCESVHRG